MTNQSDKKYYPQVLEDQPFIGPIAPASIQQNNTKSVYYPKTIAPQPIPRLVVASNVISTSLDTQSRKILGNFSFATHGAIQVGKYKSGVSGDLKISPNGIVGRNSSGTTTFSIDGTTGNATFLGTIAAGSVVSASIAANLITGQIVNAQIANIEWAKIQNVEIENADIVSLSASKITSGTLDADRIGAGSIEADKLDVTTLSAISADLGTITAGSITGVSVASSSGSSRVVLSNGNRIEFYSSSSVVCTIQSMATGIVVSADVYAAGGISTNVTQSPPGNDGIYSSTIKTGLIQWNTRSSNPSDDWALYMYENGGNYGLRTRMDGATWLVDQTAD